MNFEPDEDQRALLDAVQRLAAPFTAFEPSPGARHVHAPQLAQALAQGGFFECRDTEGLGRVTAAAMVIELARLPVCAEFAASALLPVPATLPRPWAVLADTRDGPARFLAPAGSVIALDGEQAQAAVLGPGDAIAVDSAFAFPMGRLARPDRLHWQPLAVPAATLRSAWRIAIAAEIVGALHAGLQAVIEHVTHRRQFGRPLGAFQGVQHRLAAAAALIEGARWLVLHAADQPAGSAAETLAAALAAAQAQAAVRPVCYDLHQFMGAMGLTLEHPLHRYTYGARRLQAELGGAAQAQLAAADAAFPSNAAEPA